MQGLEGLWMVSLILLATHGASGSLTKELRGYILLNGTCPVINSKPTFERGSSYSAIDLAFGSFDLLTEAQK